MRKFYIRNYSRAASRKGFTLIELLVVIAIIGLLSSVAMASLNSARAKSRDALRLTQMQQVARALEMYYSDHGQYPYSAQTESGRNNSCQDGTSFSESFGDWNTVMGTLVSGGYLSRVPRDPVNSGYGTNFSLCYKYASYNTDSNQWKRCGTSPSDNSIVMRDYGYVLLFSTETHNLNLPRFYWNNGAARPQEYCLLGPQR